MIVRSLVGFAISLAWLTLALLESNSRYRCGLSDHGAPWMTPVVLFAIPILGFSMWGSVRSRWSQLSSGERLLVGACQGVQWILWLASVPASALLFLLLFGAEMF